ncbi:MAG TPA: hypothetical protein VES65_05660 [Solirubrobacteraceae bacterium]|nr:hypothetical protein [Solirubrobacteraceae bacterium]
MPTRFDRIAVTKDPALTEALDRVTPLLGADRPAATLVHDLAIRGADAVVQERHRRREQLAWVAQATTSTETPWDPEVLERIDELAWGIPREAP